MHNANRTHLHFEVGGLRGPEGALWDLEAPERPSLESTNRENCTSEADDAGWLLERVLEGKDAVLPLAQKPVMREAHEWL